MSIVFYSPNFNYFVFFERFEILVALPAVDGAVARRQARRAEDRGHCLDDERAAVAKKNELRPHLSKYWKIPPDADAAFVAAMEEVLTVYRLPHDPRFPVVCME
jgi:hypothetical protein